VKKITEGGAGFPFLLDVVYFIAEVRVSAIDVLFSDHPKCLDLIFIYLSGLMISIGNLRLLMHPSFTDK
jgi:hypothetical protein